MTKIQVGMEAIKNNVIVKADGPNDHITFKNGKKIFIDTSFDPQRHAVISGEIIAVCQKPCGLKVGDKIFYHFNCDRDEYRLHYTEDDLLRIPIDQIYCKLADGDIEPKEDWLLAKPVKEALQTKKITTSGLEISVPEEEYKYQAVITHLPGAYKGELEVGDRVIYSKDSDIPLKILGEEYLRMKIDWIIAKLTNSKK